MKAARLAILELCSSHLQERQIGLKIVKAHSGLTQNTKIRR